MSVAGKIPTRHRSGQAGHNLAIA